MEFFPLNSHIKKPMPSQVSVIEAIEKAFAEGYKNVLLEAPVGSGKSAIAITCAKYYGTSHVITPRKNLQDQYLEDFQQEGLVLMKGRNAYPCTYPSNKNTGEYNSVKEKIERNIPIRLSPTSVRCDTGPCKNNQEVYRACTEKLPCPYNIAMGAAQSSTGVIHNLYSFIYQAYFSDRFQERNILIVDECHELENTIRGFAEKSIVVRTEVSDEDIPKDTLKTLNDWSDWLLQFSDRYGTLERMDGSTERSEYITSLGELVRFSDNFAEDFTVNIERQSISRTIRFTFTPVNIGSLTNNLILNFGTKRLLMSGTIYSKALFCKKNGLVEADTCFIRIGSTFKKETRPIVFKPEYTIDTSHRKWDENFSEMIDKIKDVMGRFPEDKGLIHTPSYSSSLTLSGALNDTGRVIYHSKDNFANVLESFYESDEPLVLLSPVCQQGVDFKYDRARFQIILRVPFLNTSDPFVEYQVKKDYPWYNHQALVTFGQQIGRINRAPDDFGVTFLLDERFGKFLSKNKGLLPKWLLEGIVYK